MVSRGERGHRPRTENHVGLLWGYRPTIRSNGLFRARQHSTFGQKYLDRTSFVFQGGPKHPVAVIS